jgi:lipid A disaccharide synthetase
MTFSGIATLRNGLLNGAVQRREGHLTSRDKFVAVVETIFVGQRREEVERLSNSIAEICKALGGAAVNVDAVLQCAAIVLERRLAEILKKNDIPVQVEAPLDMYLEVGE